MKVKILAFGQIAEITKNHTWIMDAPKTSADLVNQLETDFPELKELSYAISINKRIIHEPCLLQEMSEIALLPPFSGG
ncbi:MAG: molybdopterin synthase sulfur carrier subunit [Bacteroidetes bacterium B1(2017)]|nr:MAG: molybdopterin synthase sulfur carrier subunit [Bacteroidetes bacterium B1(2017)]